MSEYIEREALLKDIGDNPSPIYKALRIVVKNQPTADASEIMRGEWISVNDRLPERGKRVLVYSEYMRNSENGGISVNWGWMCHKRRTDITHWMPLPEPPKGVKNEQ